MSASSATVVYVLFLPSFLKKKKIFFIPLPPHKKKQNKTPTGEALVHSCLGDRKKSVPVRYDHLIYFTFVN